MLNSSHWFGLSMQPAPDLTLMMMELPAKTAAVRGLSTLWKGQFQGTMAPT